MPRLLGSARRGPARSGPEGQDPIMRSAVSRVDDDAECDSIVPVHVHGADAVDESHSSLHARRERYGFVVPKPQESHTAARAEDSTNELHLGEVVMMVLFLHREFVAFHLL